MSQTTVEIEQTNVAKQSVSAVSLDEFDARYSPLTRSNRVTTDGSDVDELSNPDGIRIFDPVAPTERARYYSQALDSRLEVLQSFEGAVTELDPERGTFRALLNDLSNPNMDVSEAEFDLRDVSSNDLSLVSPGGIFRWLIGYRRYSHGQRERVSAIVFRRLPAWTAADIEEALSEGEGLAQRIAIR